MSVNPKKLGISVLAVFALLGWVWGGVQYMYASNHADVLGNEFSSSLVHSINVSQALERGNEEEARDLLNDHISVYAKVVKSNAKALGYEDSDRYKRAVERLEEYAPISGSSSSADEIAMSDH